MPSDPIDVKRRHAEALLRLPNVVGVGVGPKVIAGHATPVMAIKVYVSQKVPRERLPPDACVPAQIEGVPTDVEVQSPLQAY